MPEPLDLEPRAGVTGRASQRRRRPRSAPAGPRPRTEPVTVTASATPSSCASAMVSRLAVGARRRRATTWCRARRTARPGARAPGHRLPLARHQPGHADHDGGVLRGRSRAVSPHRRSRRPPGWKRGRRRPRRRADEAGWAPKRRGQPRPGVVAQVGDRRRREFPIRRSSLPGAGGSAAQPTSCPCVEATARAGCLPERRSAGASSPSGAAAPNQTSVGAMLTQRACRPPPGAGDRGSRQQGARSGAG